MKAYLVTGSFLVCAVTIFFLGAVFLKGLQGKRNLTFCVFALSVFTWSFGHMFWQLAENEREAVFWIRVLVLGSSFIPYTYFHFVSEITQRRRPRLVRAGYAVAIVLAGLSWTSLIFKGVDARMGFPYWPVAGPAFGLYFGGFVLMVVYSSVLLIRQYRTASAKIRNQNKYLIIGTVIGFLGGGSNFPLWMDIPIAPWGHGLSIFYILGIGYSVLKYRLLDFDELVARFFSLIVSAVLLSGLWTLGLYAFLGYAYPQFFPRNFVLWWALLFTPTFLFFLLVPKLLNGLNWLIQSRLTPSRFAYRKELRSLSEETVLNETTEAYIEKVTRRIYEIVDLNFAAVFIRSELESGFTCKASEGERATVPLIEADRLEPLVRVLRGNRRAVFLGEEIERSQTFRREIQGLLSDGSSICSTDVFVPISSQESLYGFLVLGSSNYTGAFAEVDMLLLENLCSHLGLTLRSREIERLSNQMEKLVALGTMAAGLAHELRNPLVSIRTLASLLARNAGPVDVKPEFRETVLRDVKRISGIIGGVANFAQNEKRPRSPVDVSAALKEVAQSMGERMRASGIHFQVEGRDIPAVWGNFDQLIQVFQNIIENAVHAITEWDERPEVGRVDVSIRRRGGGSVERQRWVEVAITDNGPGITPEFQARIFDPFVTSRDTGTRRDGGGTGLGLAIVTRIIESHGGALSVRSAVGRGATFTISIPCAEEPTT